MRPAPPAVMTENVTVLHKPNVTQLPKQGSPRSAKLVSFGSDLSLKWKFLVNSLLYIVHSSAKVYWQVYFSVNRFLLPHTMIVYMVQLVYDSGRKKIKSTAMTRWHAESGHKHKAEGLFPHRWPRKRAAPLLSLLHEVCVAYAPQTHSRVHV